MNKLIEISTEIEQKIISYLKNQGKIKSNLQAKSFLKYKYYTEKELGNIHNEIKFDKGTEALDDNFAITGDKEVDKTFTAIFNNLVKKFGIQPR